MAPAGKSKVSLCHCSVANSAGSWAVTGSACPSAVSSTGSTPTSGVEARNTRAPRLAASNWAPRQAPKTGILARRPGGVGASPRLARGAAPRRGRPSGRPDDDGVEVVRVGRALAFVKLYAVYTRAAFAQDVLVDAGGLASDVLQHEHVGVEGGGEVGAQQLALQVGGGIPDRRQERWAAQVDDQRVDGRLKRRSRRRESRAAACPLY